MSQDDRRDMLPGLERFGAALKQAAEQRNTASASRRRRISRPVVVVALLSLLVVGAAGAGVLISVGEPVKRPKPSEVPPGSAPRLPPEIAVIARDPAGTLPWAARIYTSKQGKACIVAGRLKNGQLGRLEGRSFRPLPSDAFGGCGRPTPTRYFFAAGGAPGEANRGLVYGRAGSRVKAIVVKTPETTRTAKVGPGGAFLLVFDGPVDPNDVELEPRY